MRYRLQMRLAVLMLFGVCFGLSLAEVGARLAEEVRCRDRTDGFAVRSRFHGWGAAPGAEGWAQRCLQGRPEWRTYIRINSHGLRDRETPYERGRDTYRVLVLGDSFTEGLEVPLEDTYPKRLEQILRERADGGAIEVVNAGVVGWGTDNALLYYRTEGYKYHPDLVLLAFNTATDVLENHDQLIAAMGFYPPKPHYVLSDGRLQLRDFPLADESRAAELMAELERWFSRSSAFFRLVPAALREARRRLGSGDATRAEHPSGPVWEVYLEDYPPRWRQAWRITRGLLLRFRQEAAEHHARFAVVVIDGREVVSPMRWAWLLARSPALQAERCDADKPHRLVMQFLARRRIPAVSLLEDFRQRFSADARPAYFDWDLHWATPGHALAAEVIARALVERGLVPSAR